MRKEKDDEIDDKERPRLSFSYSRCWLPPCLRCPHRHFRRTKMKPHSSWKRQPILEWSSRTRAHPFAWLLAAAVVLAVGALQCPVLAAGAGQIDGISPTCASVGAQVTITGHGFGAHNVTIAVGGVPAEIVAANGHSATFILPGGVQLGPTSVTATNPGGHTGSIGFNVCDLLMPEAWGGEWDITITYRDATTQSVVATDERTAFIRTGEAFGVAVVANRGNCTGNVSDQHLEAACAVPGTTDPCTLGADVQIAADRTGETLTGSGTLTLTVGPCGSLAKRSQAYQIQITGVRVSLNQDTFGPPTTLVQSFVPFAALIG